MLTIRTIQELRRVLNTWRLAGNIIGLVPTMGNLHAGHLQLVETAKTEADKIVVSIFVNPTQFGVNEDFAAYPRTEDEDQEKLRRLNVDMVFIPAVDEIYDADAQTVISTTKLSRLHCGGSRPGHFDGVATIVGKLFNIVQPDTAVFGLKDYQQLAVIKTLVRDLNSPVRLIGVDTVREPSGLAMSSRNQYLSAEERKIAPTLYAVLQDAREQIFNGQTEYAVIEQQSLASLKQAGFLPEYFSICRNHDLIPATTEDQDLVILTAARLGKTRLIDNLYFSKPVS